MVECRNHTPKVSGSSPDIATRKNFMKELLYKLECKGFSYVEMHCWINFIWMIPLYDDGSRYFLKRHNECLAQAHIEIDFTNYKK